MREYISTYFYTDKVKWRLILSRYYSDGGLKIQLFKVKKVRFNSPSLLCIYTVRCPGAPCGGGVEGPRHQLQSGGGGGGGEGRAGPTQGQATGQQAYQPTSRPYAPAQTTTYR